MMYQNFSLIFGHVNYQLFQLFYESFLLFFFFLNFCLILTFLKLLLIVFNINESDSQAQVELQDIFVIAYQKSLASVVLMVRLHVSQISVPLYIFSRVMCVSTYVHLYYLLPIIVISCFCTA